MAGYWLIWHIPSNNALADAETEGEALATARQIVSEGSTFDDLLLMYDDPALADDELPAGIHGEELARRAHAAADPVRRTA